MNNQINVLQLTMDLGIGGSNKNLELFSKHLKAEENFDVFVASFSSSGIRAKFIENQNIKVFLLNGNYKRLKNIIDRHRIDIVHFHRLNHKYDLRIISFLKKQTNVKIVETNIFGKITNSKIENYVDLRIVKSLFLAYRFIKNNHLTVDSYWKQNRVLYNPIDFSEIYSFDDIQIQSYKSQLGIPKNYHTIGKYGRKDYLKFGDICIEMLPHLTKELPNLRYLIIGLPENLKKKAIKLGVYKYIVEIDQIEKKRELSLFISSLDILAHSSLIGETFGYVYAEAMAHGKPIVTNFTPYADNAQVEMVESQINGLIANTPKNFSKAIAKIIKDGRLRRNISQNNLRKVKKFDVKVLSSDLISMYKEILLNTDVSKCVVNKTDLINYIEYYDKIKINYNFCNMFYTTKYYLLKKNEGLKRKLRYYKTHLLREIFLMEL